MNKLFKPSTASNIKSWRNQLDITQTKTFSEERSPLLQVQTDRSNTSVITRKYTLNCVMRKEAISREKGGRISPKLHRKCRREERSTTGDRGCHKHFNFLPRFFCKLRCCSRGGIKKIRREWQLDVKFWLWIREKWVKRELTMLTWNCS